MPEPLSGFIVLYHKVRQNLDEPQYDREVASMNDFFISYNKTDRLIALAIKAWLEDAGFTTIAQMSDFHPGSNFVLEMDSAIRNSKKTLAILSPDYLRAPFPQSEWAAAFAKDPTGEHRRLVPIRVRDCQPEGLLAQVVYVDLVNLSLENMESTLIAALENKKSQIQESGKASSKRAPKSKTTEITLTATGTTNYQAGRDMVVTQKHVTKAGPVVREDHHITDGQAAKLLDLVKELGERDEKAGKKPTYGKWQNKLKSRPWAGKNADPVTSYKLIEADEFDAALNWLSQQKAKSRPSLRRTQNNLWLNEQYSKIWGCAKKLGWKDTDIYKFAEDHFELKQPITSLTDLGEQKVEKLAGAIYRRAKKL